MARIDSSLYERLATLITSMGYELVGCELSTQGRLILRIYIDSERGVTVGDCSLVSRQVSAMLDVEEPVSSGHYVLEVSSPGVDRPLFKIEHFHKYIGSRIKVRLQTPIDNRRQLKGILKRVEGEDIYLWIEDLQIEQKISFSQIEKANLIADVEFKSTNF